MSRLLLLGGLLAVLLLVPASAQATLVFQRGAIPSWVWVAEDDGTGQRLLAAGHDPRISPDGATVAFGSPYTRRVQRLLVIPAAGGEPRALLRNWSAGAFFGVFAWSPDSTTIATTVGPEIGRQTLVLVDVATGATRRIATGYFYGAGFSPDGTQLVYGRKTSDRLWGRSDVWVVPVAGGEPRRLTTHGHALYPVWGPTQIAYTRWSRPTGRHRHDDGPKYHLWLMAPDGSGQRRLTRGRIPWLLTGLVPVAWSADGTRLLAQFGGQDTSYPVAVDPATGAQRRIGPRRADAIGVAGLSSDGTTVLAYDGLFDEPRRSNVIAIPYDGTRATVLARRAALPAWTR